MLKRVHIENPDDYFIDLGKRKNKGVYFCRINGYNSQIHDFILKYYEAARLNGVKPQLANCTNAWISGKILRISRFPLLPAARIKNFFIIVFVVSAVLRTS